MSAVVDMIMSFKEKEDITDLLVLGFANIFSEESDEGARQVLIYSYDDVSDKIH